MPHAQKFNKLRLEFTVFISIFHDLKCRTQVSKCINFGIFFKLGFGFRDFWFNTDFDEEQASQFRMLIVSNPEASVQKIEVDPTVQTKNSFV